jgi:hypothetical protein
VRTLSEYAGREETLLRLEELFYSRVLTDAVLSRLVHRAPASLRGSPDLIQGGIVRGAGSRTTESSRPGAGSDYEVLDGGRERCARNPARNASSRVSEGIAHAKEGDLPWNARLQQRTCRT